MPRICLSYRRSDSAAIVGRIYDRLVARYGADSVFMDVSDIPYGADFRKHIQAAFKGTDVLLAAIGPGWLGRRADGAARIHDRVDPVRTEIQTALRQRILVIPVLVDGAKMPSAEELPGSIRDFAFRNAVSVDSGVDFQLHMERLIVFINRVLGIGPAESAAANSAAGERPLQAAPRTEARPPAIPVPPALLRCIRLLPYFLMSVIVLLLAHYVIIMKLDADPDYLRVAAVVVPAACGFLVFRNLRIGVGGATLLGLSVALVAIAGMMAVVGLIDRQAILPQSGAGWQEAAEYLVTITLATAAGDFAARILEAAAPGRWRLF